MPLLYEPAPATLGRYGLILRLHENWEKYTLNERVAGVPSTNNGTERAIGKWRIRSHSTRGFKSWAGLEGAFLLCGSQGG